MKNVINFDMPTTPKLYVHRAGRTARQEKEGTCFSIFTPGDYG